MQVLSYNYLKIIKKMKYILQNDFSEKNVSKKNLGIFKIS